MMGRSMIRLVMVLALFGLASEAAWADGMKDARRCASRSGELDVDIQYCTRAILSGDLPAAYMAKTFHNRGLAEYNLGLFEEAIADFGRAIMLAPDFAYAHADRGMAYEFLGQMDKALIDYKSTYDLGIKPKWMVKKLRMNGALN